MPENETTALAMQEQQQQPPKKETPQMLTLGKNGNDEDSHRPSSSPPSSNTHMRSRSRWLVSRLAGGGWTNERVENDDDDDDHYNAMGDESMRGTIRPNDEDASYTVLPNDPLAPENASFFFRSTDTTSPRNSTSATTTTTFKAVRNRHGEVFGYRDGVAVVPPAVLQSFRNRYAALNTDDCTSDDHDASFDLELQLEPTGDRPAPSAQQKSRDTFSTVPQSALVYEADGKRLMRLPRDQVRLVMDPDLDPGILAAVTSETTDNDTNVSSSSLEYVLTVDEDLYRRMVAEMAQQKLICVTEAGFCDIRIALVVLSIMFTILLLNSLAFHEI